jgi:PAS domain S-box-containing protein
LHQSQEEFRATLYSIGDGVITTDKKGLVKQLNPVAEALTGWKETDAKGKKLEEVFNIINEETRSTVESPVSKVLKKGLIVGLANHTLLISKNGTEIPIADSGAPIKNRKGEIDGVVLVFRDQTEERANDKALRASEERFQMLFNKAPLGYQSLDIKGNFIDINQQWLDSLGYSRHEVIGKWFGDFLAPEYKDGFRERFPVFIAQGHIHSEFEMLHKNGEKRYIAFDGKIGHDKLGEFVQTHCILKDISEEKKAELLLQKNSEEIAKKIEELNQKNQELIAAKERAEKSEEILQEQKKEIEINNQSLESLLRISQYSSTSIQELLDFALEELILLTKSKIGYIYFYNENTKQFVLNTWSKEVMSECKVMNPGTIYDLDKTGCWGEAVRQRKPIVINNYVEENSIKKGTPQGHVHLTKFLTVPVIIDNIIVAVCGVANKDSDYDNSDIRQLTLLMDSVWKISERITMIKELTLAKEKTEESESKHWNLIEQMQEGLLVVNNDDVIVLVNPILCKMLGYQKEELIGQVGYNILLKESDKQNIIRKNLDRQKGIHEQYEVEMLTKKGESIIFLLNASPVKDQNGTIVGSMATCIDVTERKKAEAELRELKNNLELEVEAKTAELREKLSELERFHDATIDREIRMKELRDEIKRLKSNT